MSRAGWSTLVAALTVAACGGGPQRNHIAEVAQQVQLAQTRGAKGCSPRELAGALLHLDFARQASDDDDGDRAAREVKLARELVAQAHTTDGAEQCSGAVTSRPDSSPDRDSDGDGVPDDADQCPAQVEDQDGFQDADGCPDADNDNDGFADVLDGCPGEAEDRDGYQDADGCPDRDDDADGIADSIDGCPRIAEDRDAHDDDDGCPDLDNDGDGLVDTADRCPDVAARTTDGCPAAVVVPKPEPKPEPKPVVAIAGGPFTLITVQHATVELATPITWQAGRKAGRQVLLAPAATPVLDELVQLLVHNPRWQIELDGHTDSRGADRANQKVSEQRAAAVRTYLVAHGVAKKNVITKGYGESVPVTDNRTAAGRAQNSRIEVLILSR